MFARSTRTLVGVAAAAIVLLAIPSSANAGADDLSTARAATAQFHQLDAATAAGYGEFRDAAKIACIETPGVGVMGIHYVNSGLVGDSAETGNDVALLVEALSAPGNMDRNIGVRARTGAHPFRRCDETNVLDPFRAPLLQDVDRLGGRATGREHRIQHEAHLHSR